MGPQRDIAVALNKIQEDHDLRTSVLFALVLKELASRLPSQELLHPEMQRVLDENRWQLYAR